MVARTPVAKGTAGYVPPGSMFLDDIGATPDTLANGRIVRTGGLKHAVWYFTDIDGGELWTTPPAGVVSLALCSAEDNANSDVVARLNASRQVVFSSVQGNNSGYLHTWSRGGKVRASGTDVPPIRAGDSGFIHPVRCVRAPLHDAGATNAFTSGRTLGILGARHRVAYFAAVDSGDTWAWSTSNPAKLVAIAWQAGNGAVDTVAPTINTTHGVTFFSAVSGNNGWLHYWTRG